MTTPRRSLAAALVLLIAACLPRPTQATVFQWDGGLSHAGSADANWSTGNNWVGGGAPSQNTSFNNTDVVFLSTALRTTSNDDVSLFFPSSAAPAIHSLTFNVGTTAYMLSSSAMGGSTLAIGSGGIVQNSQAAQTISATVSVVAAESWTFGSGSGALTFTGGLNIADGGSLTVNSTTRINFTSSSGVMLGTSNVTNPSATGSSLTITGGATFSPASFQIAGSGSVTQNSGTLTTGAITMGQFGSGTFYLLGTGQVNATSLTVGSQTGTNSFLQDAGSVNLNNGALAIGAMGSNGTYTINAGSLSAGSISIGVLNVGTFNQNGGTVTVGGAVTLGNGRGSTVNSYNMTGGQLTAGSIGLGALGPGAFVQTGGTVIVNGGIGVGGEAISSYTLSGVTSTVTAASVTIGSPSASSGSTFTVNSGALNVAGGGSILVGAGNSGASTGTFTQNGGTVTVAQGGPLQLSNVDGTGTYNLNGGSLAVGRVGTSFQSQASATSTFNFNGGTLQANASSTTFMAGLTRAIVKLGGAKIDPNGQSITISQALLHDPALTGNALDGGLTKLGGGALVLSGANTYNGGTLISGGMLEAALNGALGTGNVMLGPGGFALVLDANVTDAIANTAALSLDSTVGGKLLLLGSAGVIQETVAALDFNGVSQVRGTYGATGSGAQFIDDTHFSGKGILAVGAVPEPGTGVLAGTGALLAAALWRRRRRA